MNSTMFGSFGGYGSYGHLGSDYGIPGMTKVNVLAPVTSAPHSPAKGPPGATLLKIPKKRDLVLSQRYVAQKPPAGTGGGGGGGGVGSNGYVSSFSPDGSVQLPYGSDPTLYANLPKSQAALDAEALLAESSPNVGGINWPMVLGGVAVVGVGYYLYTRKGKKAGA